jgi:hypothetical protein
METVEGILRGDTISSSAPPGFWVTTSPGTILR